VLLTLFASAPHDAPRGAAAPAMARTNDYQRSAGVMRDGALTVRLVAQRAQWRPADEQGVALPAAAFGEEGAPPSIPDASRPMRMCPPPRLTRVVRQARRAVVEADSARHPEAGGQFRTKRSARATGPATGTRRPSKRSDGAA
jgi:hypothetical protein